MVRKVVKKSILVLSDVYAVILVTLFLQVLLTLPKQRSYTITNSSFKASSLPQRIVALFIFCLDL